MPIVLRRPAPMELAELIAGATIKRRLRSKQSIQRRLTKKQPLSGNSLPQSSDPATQTVPDVEEHPIVSERTQPLKMEEHPVVPERTEPWRPKRRRGMHSLLKSKKCAMPWSTGCIENLGIQTSGAWWTVCVKIVLIQQCWRPPNSCTARLARRVPECYLVL